MNKIKMEELFCFLQLLQQSLSLFCCSIPPLYMFPPFFVCARECAAMARSVMRQEAIAVAWSDELCDPQGLLS